MHGKQAYVHQHQIQLKHLTTDVKIWIFCCICLLAMKIGSSSHATRAHDFHAKAVSGSSLVYSAPSVRYFWRLGHSSKLGDGVGDTAVNEDGPQKLAPFQRGRPAIDMDKRVEQVLAKGQAWQSTELFGNIAILRGVMDVQASPGIVLDQLLDFASYPKKVPIVRTCEIYKRHVEMGLGAKLSRLPFQEQGERKEGAIRLPGILPRIASNGGMRALRMANMVERSFVKFVCPVLPGIKLKCHVDLTYEPVKNSITWTLDEEKRNDFREVQGHWHVAPYTDDLAKSRVFYEIGLVAPRWLPRALFVTIVKQALNPATSWVKRESEREAASTHRPFPSYK